MDAEGTTELLGRYVDGDMEDEERAALELRLAGDPALARELAELVAVRSAVRAVADGMEPPELLDRMLEPLRRSGRPQEALAGGRRLRWLAGAAAAAAAVAALAVGLHVGHPVLAPGSHRAGPTTVDEPHPRPAQPDGIFRLAPLPTSSVPTDDQPLGIAERLQASPPPEPRLQEPPAMRVLGPLSEEDRERLATGTDSGATADRREARLEGGGLAEAKTIHLRRPLPVGTYPVEVEAAGGVLRRVWPTAADGVGRDRLQDALVGVPATGLADGHHRLTLVVGASAGPS